MFCVLLFSGILLHTQLADLWFTLGPLAFYRVDLVIVLTNAHFIQACHGCITQLVHDSKFDTFCSLCLVQEKLCCLVGNSCLNV